MPQIVQCPSCSSKLQVPDKAKKARCPKCSQVIEVGTQSTGTPKAAAKKKPAQPSSAGQANPAPRPAAAKPDSSSQPQAAKKVVRCPSCQAPLKLSASVIGKKVRCPKCSNTFTAGAVKKTKPVAPVQATPSSADPFDDDDLFGSLPNDSAGQAPGPFDFGSAPMPPASSGFNPPASSGFGGGYQQPYAAPQTIHTTKPRRSSGDWQSWLTEAPKVLMLMGIVAAVCFVLSAIPMVGMAVFAVVGISYVVIQTVGGIWLMVIAFQEDVVQGILYLLVPFYALFYLITRWNECRVPFMLCLVSVVSFFSSFAGFMVGMMVLGSLV